MKTDLYTKIVLTVVALCLVCLVAHTQWGGPMDVSVVNRRLNVRVRNGTLGFGNKPLEVRVVNEPLNVIGVRSTVGPGRVDVNIVSIAGRKFRPRDIDRFSPRLPVQVK